MKLACENKTMAAWRRCVCAWDTSAEAAGDLVPTMTRRRCDSAVNTTNVTLEVEAVADVPNLAVDTTMPVTKEDEWLTVVVTDVSLVDTDGSETLELELRTSDSNIADVKVFGMDSAFSLSYSYGRTSSCWQLLAVTNDDDDDLRHFSICHFFICS